MADVKFSTIFGASSGGPMNGAPFPGYRTNVAVWPHYVTKAGATLATTATRAYYAALYVNEGATFASVRLSNQSSGESGNKLRVAVYANDGTSGPGTLIQDIGEITLTASVARRTITTTIDLSAYAGRWVWVMVHMKEASSMYDMRSSVTAGESTNGAGIFGSFEDGFAGSGSSNAFCYVDTAYGAAASTAVTPTNSIGIMPAFGLVK